MIKNDEEILNNHTNSPEMANNDINQEDNIEINNSNSHSLRPKLFSKNPNKENNINKHKIAVDDEEEDKEDLVEKQYFMQNESEDESLNKDDSNIDHGVDVSNYQDNSHYNNNNNENENLIGNENENQKEQEQEQENIEGML